MEAFKTPFNKTQLEIMALVNRVEDEEELLALKDFISQHYASKLVKEADRIWDERGYTQATMDAWMKEPT